MLVAPMASPPAHASVAAQDELSRKAVEEYAELEAAGKTKSSKGLEEIRSKVPTHARPGALRWAWGPLHVHSHLTTMSLHHP